MNQRGDSLTSILFDPEDSRLGRVLLCPRDEPRGVGSELRDPFESHRFLLAVILPKGTLTLPAIRRDA